MVVWGGLSWEKKRNKGEKERFTHLNAEFQRIAQRDKKGFLSDQCKEIEENNRMGKTRELSWRRQWHPTPVLLPGKSHGWRSLEGCSPWSRWGLDTTERLQFYFSFSLFTFIKRFFSSSSPSAIRVVSSAYLRLLIFLPAMLIPACASSGPAFLMMYSVYKLNKQGDNMQPWHTPFPICNLSVVLCPVLMLLPDLHTDFSRDRSGSLVFPSLEDFSTVCGDPMSSQGWFPLRLTGLMSLLSKGLSGVFSSSTVQKHQFFVALASLWSSSHNCMWLRGRP